MFVLGSDIGSSGCKTLIANDEGEVIARASRTYPLHHPQSGWSEYDPQDWYTAFCETVQEVLTSVNSAEIKAICIVGITHNPVLLDANNQPVRSVIHFNDLRSLPQCEALKEKWGDEILQRATNAVGSLWTLPQLHWVKANEPENWAATQTLLFPKDYIRHRITDYDAPMTDHIEACGTLFFDPVAGTWIEALVSELRSDILPGVGSPFDPAGEISLQGAEDSGLKVGTPVIIGTTDTAAEMLGTGALAPGTGMVKLASVGRIAFVTTEPARHHQIINYPYFEDLWYPGTATKYGTLAFRWLHDNLWVDNPDYTAMDEAAKQAEPDGLLFLPHLMGQFAPQWNPKLSAGFIGVGLQHDLRHFTRAVLEGVAFSIRDAFEEMNRLGFDADRLMLIGNGARSPLWQQIMSDVFGREFTVPKERDAAYGAVLMAGMTAGYFSTKITELSSHIQLESRTHPISDSVMRYDSLFKIYQEANAALTPIAERIYDFRNA